MFAVYFAYLLVTAVPAAAALAEAFGAGIALFLSWALGREIDPVYQWSAFYAQPFVLAASLYYGAPALLNLFFILLIMRFLNRSTGLRPTVLDALMLILLGAVLYYNGVYSGLPLLLLVLVSDYVMEPVKSKLVTFILPAVFVSALSFYFFNDLVFDITGLSARAGFLIFILVIFLIYVIIATGKVSVAGDNKDVQPDTRRINLARLFAVLFIATEVMLKGELAFVMFYPAVLAVAGSALYHLIQKIKS
ncbi:MAG: hypothetical protein ACQES4_00740 [Bacillota bacterium]